MLLERGLRRIRHAGAGLGAKILDDDFLNMPVLLVQRAKRDAGLGDGVLQLGPPAVTLPAWAAAGGQVVLNELQMDWGPLQLQGDASLTLDQEQRPLGAGRARVRGFEAAVGAFTEAGLMEEDIGSMARLALLAMSSENSDGERQIEVPITAQDGILRVGPLPLMPLPPLF